MLAVPGSRAIASAEAGGTLGIARGTIKGHAHSGPYDTPSSLLALTIA